MGMLSGGFYSKGDGSGGIVFAPNIIGWVHASANNNVIQADGDDTNTGPSSASAGGDIWVIADASETRIRVTGSASGNITADYDWFDDLGANQSTPGTDENVFILNDRADSVNIFTISADSGSGLTKTAIGSFTDDDKSTFFSLTNATKYGYTYLAEAADPGTSFVASSLMRLQFTFRKAGLDDYTVEFSSRITASADDSS